MIAYQGDFHSIPTFVQQLHSMCVHQNTTINTTYTLLLLLWRIV
jgi:hypothetical protein